MTSATDIKLIDEQQLVIETKKRSVIYPVVLVSILAIALFLGLFVLELSQILTLTGAAN